MYELSKDDKFNLGGTASVCCLNHKIFCLHEGWPYQQPHCANYCNTTRTTGKTSPGCGHQWWQCLNTRKQLMHACMQKLSNNGTKTHQHKDENAERWTPPKQPITKRFTQYQHQCVRAFFTHIHVLWHYWVKLFLLKKSWETEEQPYCKWVPLSCQ